MASINPYNNFNENAEEAFNFYKLVFDGKFAKIMHFKDLASTEFPLAEKEEDKIIHITLPIGKTFLRIIMLPKVRVEKTKMRTEAKLQLVH